jgi:hypothetical protein
MYTRAIKNSFNVHKILYTLRQQFNMKYETFGITRCNRIFTTLLKHNKK